MLALSLTAFLMYGPSQDIFVDGYLNGNRVQIALRDIPGVDVDGKPLRLEREAAEAYGDMLEAAAKDGIFLSTHFAFRTMRQQRYQYHGNRRMAAKPGYSIHQSGRAIDTNAVVGRKRTAVYWWLKGNAARFGYRPETRSEPWHWVYDPS